MFTPQFIPRFLNATLLQNSFKILAGECYKYIKGTGRLVVHWERTIVLNYHKGV